MDSFAESSQHGRDNYDVHDDGRSNDCGDGDNENV